MIKMTPRMKICMNEVCGHNDKQGLCKDSEDEYRKCGKNSMLVRGYDIREGKPFPIRL